MKKVGIILALLIIVIVVVVIFRTQTAKQTETSTSQIVPSQLPTQKVVTSADNAPIGSIHNLPVPKPVAVARSAAAKLFGVPEGEVIVMTAFEKEWPDSCLGLVGKDEMCSDVITPGFEVTLQGNGKEVIYRTNNDGTSIRLQK